MMSLLLDVDTLQQRKTLSLNFNSNDFGEGNEVSLLVRVYKEEF